MITRATVEELEKEIEQFVANLDRTKNCIECQQKIRNRIQFLKMELNRRRRIEKENIARSNVA